jgi:hypothetical protein
MALRPLDTEGEHIDRFFVSNLINKTLVNTHQIAYIYAKIDDCNEAKLVSCEKEKFEIASLRVNKNLKETVPENLNLKFTSGDVKIVCEGKKVNVNQLLSNKQYYSHNKINGEIILFMKNKDGRQNSQFRSHAKFNYIPKLHGAEVDAEFEVFNSKQTNTKRGKLTANIYLKNMPGTIAEVEHRECLIGNHFSKAIMDIYEAEYIYVSENKCDEVFLESVDEFGVKNIANKIFVLQTSHRIRLFYSFQVGLKIAIGLLKMLKNPRKLRINIIRRNLKTARTKKLKQLLSF